MPKQNFVTVAEAATQTGYSREHVRNMARLGTIPSQKVATIVLVDISALQAHKAESPREMRRKRVGEKQEA